LRFGDCDVSVDNAKISAQSENANLTLEIPNLTQVTENECINDRHYLVNDDDRMQTTDRQKNPHQSVLPTVNIIPLKLLFFIFITNSLNAIGSQKIACLCLLDLSAAFDTIDHSILIYRLSSWFGFRGSVLNWFKSYICHLGLSVLSVTAPSLPLVSPHVVFLGVAVLGPLLFIMYTTVHNPTRYSHCISLSLNRHLYVDDKLTQLFLSFYH